MIPEEKKELDLRRRIEHAVYSAGFPESRIRFLREGLPRLGPRALAELLLLIQELDGRARRPQEQGSLF